MVPATYQRPCSSPVERNDAPAMSRVFTVLSGNSVAATVPPATAPATTSRAMRPLPPPAVAPPPILSAASIPLPSWTGFTTRRLRPTDGRLGEEGGSLLPKYCVLPLWVE
jgi:hypothetical protein